MTTPAQALQLRVAPPRGRGVFAARSFAVGEVVLVFVGPIVGLEAVEDHARYLQVDDDRFLGPSGDVDDFVNHACEPNCGVYEEPGEVAMRALVPIAAGDEVCFDYSTWMAGGVWTMDCRCGAGTCRGRITDFERLPAAVRRRYLDHGAVPAFVRRRLRR